MHLPLLWPRIATFVVAGERNQRFLAELQAQSGWSAAYAELVYTEYLRFIYLLRVSERPLTPPPAIDRVWQLHLSHSRSYWIDLCQNLLRRPLHRNPYSGLEPTITHTTLSANASAIYREEFAQEPPALVWGGGGLLMRGRRLFNRERRLLLLGGALLLLSLLQLITGWA